MLFYPALGLKSGVQKCSIYQTVNELIPAASILNLALWPGSDVFLSRAEPTGQKDKMEHITVELRLCTVRLKRDAWKYSTTNILLSPINCLKQKLALWPVVFSRTYRPEGQDHRRPKMLL